jgi:hypothetical protein
VAPPDTSALCAQWSRRQQLDPVGTAGSYAAYLLVDWSLPWPADLGDIADLAKLKPALRFANCRLQGMVAGADPSTRRVALYSRDPAEPFSGYRVSAAITSADRVVGVALDLLEALRPGAGAAAPGHDVLICTHGRRDRCCGSLGTDLAQSLLAAPGLLGPGVRVERTSHTGGHRFAPTAIVLPEGTVWAYADAQLLADVVGRRASFASVAPFYRGCAGIESPRVQALERAVLVETGWDLLDWPRRGHDDGGGSVALRVEPPGQAPILWEATVEAARRVALPECGSPLDTAVKFADELAVGDLRRAG